MNRKQPTPHSISERSILAAAKKFHAQYHLVPRNFRGLIERAPRCPILSSRVSLEGQFVILTDRVGFTIYTYRAFKSGRIAFRFYQGFTHDFADEAMRDMRARAKELRAQLRAVKKAA